MSALAMPLTIGYITSHIQKIAIGRYMGSIDIEFNSYTVGHILLMLTEPLEMTMCG